MFIWVLIKNPDSLTRDYVPNFQTFRSHSAIVAKFSIADKNRKWASLAHLISLIQGNYKAGEIEPDKETKRNKDVDYDESMTEDDVDYD